MELARKVIVWLGLFLIAGGYAMSQLAVFQGTQADYAQRLENPAVIGLLMIYFVGAVGVFLASTKETSNDQ